MDTGIGDMATGLVLGWSYSIGGFALGAIALYALTFFVSRRQPVRVPAASTRLIRRRSR